MLYPNLQLNLSKVNGKKRPLYLYGVDEHGTELTDSNNNLEQAHSLMGGYFEKLPTPSIDTPKILAMVDDMNQEKLFGQLATGPDSLRQPEFMAPLARLERSPLAQLSASAHQTSVSSTMTNSANTQHLQVPTSVSQTLISVSSGATGTTSVSTDSLQTPVVDVNANVNPFFQTLISPMDNYSCVAPNDVFGFPAPPTTVSAPSQDMKMYNVQEMMQQDTRQNEHHSQNGMQSDFYPPVAYTGYGPITYPPNSMVPVSSTSSSTDTSYIELKPRVQSELIHSHQQQSQQQQQMSHTEHVSRAGPGAHFSDEILIPNTITDHLYAISTCSSRNSYSLAPSPCPSSGSQTSSSTMDTKCELKYSEYESEYVNAASNMPSGSVPNGGLNLSALHSAVLNRSSTGQKRMLQSRCGSNEQMMLKKSRMTKKQKFDAMMNEEKNLLQDNDQLRKEISELECKIIMYRNSLMDVVKRGPNK